MRIGLRSRWRSWLAMAVLISVVGGFVLATAAAGRRTAAAFPAFVAAHGYDSIVYSTHPVPEVARLPGVTEATPLIIPDTGQPTCFCTHPISSTANFSVAVIPAGSRAPYKLVSGRLPDPSHPDQVLASFTLQQDDGVHIGSVISVPFEAPSQAADYNNPNTGLPTPRGPTVSFRVVGIEASEFEFPSGSTPVYLLYAGQAFSRNVLPHTASDYQYLVRLRDGTSGLSVFDGRVGALDLGIGTVGASNQDGQAASVVASIHPQAVGWWILSLLAGLVGLAVVGQALSRQSAAEAEDFPTWLAVGADRRQLIALAMARNIVVGLAGGVGALVVAAALSPLAPLGEARTAESTTGFHIDPLVLPLGAVVTWLIVVALGIWPSARAARVPSGNTRGIDARPSVVVPRVAALGAPPSMVIGVRNALERRSGGSSVPLGSALLGITLAVVALCGTGVFGASLSYLTAHSALWGEPQQLTFTPPNPALKVSLEHNPAVAAITNGAGAGEITVDHVNVGVMAATAVRGPLLFSSVSGHLPTGTDQIGLGVNTMRAVGAHLGSVVSVTVGLHSGRQRTLPFRVVSQTSFPEFGGFVSLGTGALITTAGLLHAVCPPGPNQALCRQKTTSHGTNGIRVLFVAGPQGRAALNHYLAAYPSITTQPTTPTSLVNFGEAVNFPLIFGAMLAIFGAATLTHLLVLSVSRRRREIGLLKVLGFVRGQVISSVNWQATTLSLIGVVIGVPLGVVAGKATWNLFANNLGVVPVPVVPLWFVAVLAVSVIVVANLLAIGPAAVATRSTASRLLGTSD